MAKQTAGAETDVELNQPLPDQTVKPRPVKRRFPWVVALLGLVLVLAGIWYLVRKQTNAQPTAATPTTAVTPSTTVNPATSSSADAKVIDAGVTWQKPEQLGDLGLVTKTDNQQIADAYEGVTYWQVGATDGGGKLILARAAVTGMGTTYEQQYFWQSKDVYYRLPNNSDPIDYRNTAYKIDYQTGKLLEGTLYLQSIVPDNEIVQGETRLLRKEKSASYLHQLDWNIVRQELVGAQKIADTKWGPLYSKTSDIDLTKSDKHIKGDSYFMLLNDGTTLQYSVRPTWQRDDNTLDLASDILPDGVIFTAVSSSVSGCGGGGYGSFVVTSGLTWQDNQQVATTKSGKKLYTVVEASSPDAQAGLTIVNLGRGTDYAPAKKVEDMIADKGVFFWIDDYGTTHIFMREDYQPPVECGKPVIYLYPTVTTSVSVKVGAQVRLSEPNYGDGWQVIAHPNGQLETNGQTYPNLFWEGKGDGVYPEIKVGQIVARAAAVATIKANLNEMGLTAQETSDFLDFWAPKLPTTPYVRLTWLTNNELDQLAPLTITPQPDSVIRVFLDFAGLDTPVQLPTQQLPHYQRTGFTAVEWGGLLVGEN